MHRAGWIAAAIVGWTVCGATRSSAQAPPPEGWVVLSVDEYRALRDRSLGIGPPQPGAPVDGTLSRVEYDLHIEGDAIVGRALLTVDVLRDGWAHIAIPAGLRASDARIDGEPAAIVEAAPPYLLLSRAGRAIVSLDVVMPLTATAGTEAVILPASPAPITRTSLVLPASGVDLSLTGGFVADHVETADESRWTVFGHPNEPLKLIWKHRVDDRRATLPLRVRARIAELVGYGEDGGQMSASVRIEIVQGTLQDVVLAVPPGLVINEVNGATVADWQVIDGALRVRLLEPVASETAFIVESEMRAPREGRMVVPIVRVPSAERESGGVAVDVVGAGEITERQASGLEPTDPSELGDFVAVHESPSLMAFRLRPLAGSEARALSVTVIRYTPQAVLVANIEEARYRVLAAEQRLLVEARYAVRNNQRSFLKVSLPIGATVWSAVVDGQPIRPGVAEDNALLLPLGKGRAGQEAPASEVLVVYLQRASVWHEGERAVVELPAVDLPISRTGVRMFFPPQFAVTPQPGTFRPATDAGPFADAFRTSPAVRSASKSAVAANAPPAALQSLVDRFRSEGGERRVVGALPVDVAFPEFGPSIFLASELTAEGKVPSVELAVKRARK